MNNPFESIDERLSKIENLLLDLKEIYPEKSSSPETDELLTVQETAIFLSLSVPTIYGLIHKGDIPVMKRSKRCYFSKSDLLNYLKEGKKKTNSEIETEAKEYIKRKK